MISDVDLRLNHQFIRAFESLRKAAGHREMSDEALHVVAKRSGISFEDLRVARHLRNALAHDEPVNRERLAQHLNLLTESAGEARSTDRPPRLHGGQRAFRLHGWRDPDIEEQMIANGFVSIGGDEIGDLAGVDDPELIRSALTSSMTDRSARAINIFVGYWRRFLWEATAGDLIVLPTQHLGVAIGALVGPYFYVKSARPKAKHRREVDWIAFDISREDFDPDLLRTISGRHTVQDFRAPNAVERLKAIAQTGSDPGPSLAR